MVTTGACWFSPRSGCSLALAEVAALASELYAQSSFAMWLADLMCPWQPARCSACRSHLYGRRCRTPIRAWYRRRLRPAYGWAPSGGPADTRRTAAGVVRSHCLGCYRSPSGRLSPGWLAAGGHPAAHALAQTLRSAERADTGDESSRPRRRTAFDHLIWSGSGSGRDMFRPAHAD